MNGKQSILLVMVIGIFLISLSGISFSFDKKANSRGKSSGSSSVIEAIDIPLESKQKKKGCFFKKKTLKHGKKNCFNGTPKTCVNGSWIKTGQFGKCSPSVDSWSKGIKLRDNFY
jgi:hypothetical protein